MEIDEKLANIVNRSTNVLSIGMQHLTDAQYINQLLLSTLLSMNNHQKDTNKYFNILNDEIESNFFNIIDVIIFQETIQNIQENEIRKSPVFSLKPHEILRISTTVVKLLNNTIQISVHVPLPSKEKFKIFSLTPIPVRRDGNSFILNEHSKHIIYNRTIYTEIPISTLVKCIQSSKLIICDKLLFNKLAPLNDCLSANINNQSTEAKCTYKLLPNQNEIIKISDELLYAYIVEPMSFKITCGTNKNIYNLTQSMEIRYGKICKFSDNKDYFSYDESSTIIKINTDFTEPNFEIFNKTAWQNAEFLN